MVVFYFLSFEIILEKRVIFLEKSWNFFMEIVWPPCHLECHIQRKSYGVIQFFALELKFTIDTLVKWFNATFKQKILELSSFQKHAFVQKSPVEFSKTICCICGFMLSLSARDGHERTLNLMTWYDFIVRNKSILFWKNIYDPEDIK